MARPAVVRSPIDDEASADSGPVKPTAALSDFSGLAVALAGMSEADAASTLTLRVEFAFDRGTIEAIFAAFRARDIGLALGLPMFADELERSIGCASATRKSFQLSGLPTVRVDGKSDPRFFPDRIKDWFLSEERSAAPRGPGRPRKRGS
jgi:hypothetical protein